MARSKFDHGDFIKWIGYKIDCSISTVYRYITYSMMIMHFPHLIQCDLNRTQITFINIASLQCYTIAQNLRKMSLNVLAL